MFNEKEILKFWEENKIFEKSLKRRAKKPLFSFYDGPPFLSGKPHYGHILATTIKDTVARFWTMRGFRVERRVGWDCHGLPVENLVEQNLGVKTKKDIEKIGVAGFNAACRNYALSCEKDFKETLRRVGRWADYDNAYFTFDNSYMESVWWMFKKLWDKNLVYKDFRVTPYCPRCGTPISNFEVNQGYRETEDPSIFVKFPVKGEKNTYFLVWTTTPWTLTANTAIAINPELNYKKYFINGEYFWSYNPLSAKAVEEVSGKKLVGKGYEPFYKSEKGYYRVLPADFVKTDEGTGLVHIAPAFGEDDMKIGKKNNLSVLITADEEGKMKTPGYSWNGFFVKEADKLIIEDLGKRNLLYKKETVLHQYPFCWRCDSPLLYYPLNTWYIAVTKLKNKLIKNNKKIHWVPEHIKEGRFGKWLAEVRDWAFSRNRFWGAALPIWQCNSCHKNIVISSLKELSESAVSSGNKYFILRHGWSECNQKNILSCWPENKKIELTVKGKKQIEKISQILKKKNIQLIFFSDLLRTKETAEIVSKNISAPVKFDQRLREWNSGIFNGKSREDFENFFGEEINKFSKTPENGENLNDVRKRMMNFILELEKKYQHKNILIISHGHPLWILEEAVQGFSDKKIVKLKKDYLEPGAMKEIKFQNLPYDEFGRLNLHRPYIDKIELNCPKCGSRAKRVSEVFDCWFESGAMPYAQWHYPFENKELMEKTFPADFIAEGLDQTRGWFYTLHVLATALFDKPAFKNVVVNGLILDDSGRKLSKKLRNYAEPGIIFEKYGADALRYFLLSSTQLGENYQFSEKGVEEIFRKVIDKFKNIFNFYQLYTDRFSGEADKLKTTHILDRWILTRLNEVFKEITEKMEIYELTGATRVLMNFIDDFSNWYLRRSRKRIPAVLGYVILETSKLLAPFAPFISEAVYLDLTKKSVHLEDWGQINKKLVDKKLLKEMAEIRRIASLALAKRLEAGIKVRQPLATLKIRNPKFEIRNNKELLEILADEINVKEIIFDKKIKDEILLDTQITPELKIEGTLRDLIRLVQDLRKSARCQSQDKIILTIKAPTELKTILENKKDFLKKEINARDIDFGHFLKFDAELTTKIDNQLVWLGIRKLVAANTTADCAVAT
jgi:isoleucyl-tRNA synthetase